MINSETFDVLNEKVLKNVLTVLEKSWNFLSVKVWEPCSYFDKILSTFIAQLHHVHSDILLFCESNLVMCRSTSLVHFFQLVKAVFVHYLLFFCVLYLELLCGKVHNVNQVVQRPTF